MTIALPATVPAEHVVIIDFGSQTAQLIARRIRENGVFAWLVPPTTSAAQIRDLNPSGIVLSGGPASVHAPDAPTMDAEILSLDIPVLGICYGMQLMCHLQDERVQVAETREFGRATLDVIDSSDLLAGVPESMIVWMSHGDQVVPSNDANRFTSIARTRTCPLAAIRHRTRAQFGVQFHPEVTHTPHGEEILRNFVFRICGCGGHWKMTAFLDAEVQTIRQRVGASRVICGLSGGVDSSVCAAILSEAIGDQLTCVFIDNGLLRSGERQMVETIFREHSRAELRVVDASQEFLQALNGVTEPQEKRKRIGHCFIDAFRSATGDLPDAHYLAQGTLYPDVIESGHTSTGKASGIKLHHNVGGLPEELGYELVEPLRDLFKDEVRALGRVLGLPSQIIDRHPFPGPGLAVRIMGEVTPEHLRMVRACDEIVIDEIVAHRLYRRLSQVFAVLLPVQTVGVMGDARTYENVVAVRAVETEDFMTADWARIPFDVLAKISSRITNEVRGVNRVVYDISSKPPATIEWE